MPYHKAIKKRYIIQLRIRCMQEHRAVLSSLTARLGDPGLAEVTVVLIGADDQLAASASRQDFAWLSETSLLSDLVDRWARELTPRVADVYWDLLS